MIHPLPHLSLHVNPNTYHKDPASSELGRKIITGGIDLIDDLGFEKFTFRKLAAKIGSTEASLYRYFENKHRLLLYLYSWYWSWMEYRLLFDLHNVSSAEERLERSLRLLTEEVVEDSDFSHINEVKLHKLVVTESSKAYLTKEVDEENKEGVYSVYKRLVGRVADIVLEISPKYKYPHMLISTAVEGAHLQRFFADHLPLLTDVVKGEDAVMEFYRNMVFQTIR